MRERDQHITEDLTTALGEGRPAPRHRRALLIVAAGVTAAAAVGTGAWAALHDGSDADTGTAAATQPAPAPQPLGTVAGAPGSPAASASGPSAVPPASGRPAPASPRARTPKPGSPAPRPGAADADAVVAATDFEVITESFGSPRDGKTLKVVSGRGDLSHTREMVWVTDESEAVGPARCTQTFKINYASPARKRPTMLLCWRITDTRSAYTLMVDFDGDPSRAESIEALQKAWAKLD